METTHYLRALARSWLVVLLTTIAGGLGGMFVYLQATPEYSSTVRLYVTAQPKRVVDELSASQIAAARALSLAEIASTQPAVTAAEQAAGLPGTAVGVTAAAPTGQPFVVITVTGADATSVQRIANAYTGTLASTAETLSGKGSTPITVSGLGPASYSSQPISPILSRDLGLGIAVGLALGIALVVLRELLSQSVDSVEDLNAITGARVLGIVPRDLPKVRLPVRAEPRSSRAEAYRQIRTALLTTPQPIARVIAVTSALPREGKTSVSTNLALSLNRAGYRVVLVDADLRRPQVRDFFELDTDLGLTDVLVGRAQLTAALTPVTDSLSVLCAGSEHPDPSELLGTVNLAELIEKLVADFDFVVIDTAPALPVTDPLVVAPRVDGVVVVTRLGRTLRSEIRRVHAAVESTGARVIGYVGNQVRRRGVREYRYGYYGSDDREGDRPRPRPRLALDEDSPGKHAER